ncbi:PQQ-dependent sugar dehydrogenase [Rivularia sp. UHCC 0363]|uniref:PQQ-dependent sugar dehydrogenase n=1 Tax=Rivularia sp. UHCC 0363 TaxID=3110244 RepID=UPI002B1FD917|nr:PQQ-dependent sugar dehydrogenase [Rivularia sp. UHCC 0363]MEA5592946.1 PQQ-dependent sugar dehydrogenase [Rivularia sp. UHCC 0363]
MSYLSKRLLSGAAIAFIVAGCSSAQNPLNSSSAIGSESNYGIPPSGDVPKANNFKKTKVVEGLENPWSMAWLPDGTMLITERPGRLRIVRNGVLDPTPITGVPEVFAVSQGGLMEVSLHPKFAQNRLVYLTYSHGTEEANRTRIARAKFDGKALQDVQVIFEVSPTKPGGQHFGSRIVWLPDNTMLLAIGDGGNPPLKINGELPRQQAQKLDSQLGKIVRLNDDGSIPKDNPFVSTANANPAVWSYGHRNIQGLTFDAENKRVWSTEHGSKGGDEVNLEEAGKNYGWPVVTYSREYSGGEISQERSRPGMVDPKLVWTPSIAPSGLAFYKGDLFAGGLVSQDVRHIDLNEKGNVVSEKSIEIGQRVRDVKVAPDGKLYVITDEDNGQLIRLEAVGN